MPDRFVRFWLFAALVVMFSTGVPSPARAEQMTAVSSEYQDRASELLEILKGSQKEESFFASSFLDAIPVTQFRALVTQLQNQYGEPLSIARIIPASKQDGTVEISYAKATLAMRMVLDSAAPYPVIGLQVTGANMTDDSIDKIKREMEALPGAAGFEIAEIGADQASIIESLNADRQFAIGSAFKLYVLAALSTKIADSDRSWRDVVPLYRKSLPSGILQDWPDRTPMTLQALATLMISVSDNTATDILMTELGSKAIDDLVYKSGHSAPEKMLPMLSTVEFFDLKMPHNADVRRLYIGAGDGEQRDLLSRYNIGLTPESIEISNLANKPQHIDTIEWFASPSDITGLLEMIDNIEDPVVKKILKINPLIPPGDALRWNYIGGKGGSEPGVISLAFLTKSKSGKTYAVSGSWNNIEAPVDNDEFTLMMNRLLNLVAAR
ncbi:MAG: serine hydrolase [Parasphingorhabdus sp.]